MHLTLQQLRLFNAVARHSSFTRAAEQMHLTQPAVSIQVKRLEEQVGLPLFEQVGKRIFLTAAGNEMFSASYDILGRVNELEEKIADLQGELKGPLLLSVVTTSKYFMPHLLGAFLQQFPDVEPRLVFLNQSDVIQRLNDNLDDFVVMGQIPNTKDLEAFPFVENILVVAAPPDHPMVKKKKVTLEQLVNERILVREPGSGTRKAVDRILENHDLKIEPYMELGSNEAIKHAVMAGLGLSVISLHSLMSEYRSKQLAILNVENFPIRRRWYAVHLKGKKLSLVSRTFLEFILGHGEEILKKADLIASIDSLKSNE